MIRDVSFDQSIELDFNNNNIGTITINNGGTGTLHWFRGESLSAARRARTLLLTTTTIGGTAANSITDNVVGSYAMYAIPVPAAPT